MSVMDTIFLKQVNLDVTKKIDMKYLGSSSILLRSTYPPERFTFVTFRFKLGFFT